MDKHLNGRMVRPTDKQMNRNMNERKKEEKKKKKKKKKEKERYKANSLSFFEFIQESAFNRVNVNYIDHNYWSRQVTMHANDPDNIVIKIA